MDTFLTKEDIKVAEEKFKLWEHRLREESDLHSDTVYWNLLLKLRKWIMENPQLSTKEIVKEIAKQWRNCSLSTTIAMNLTQKALEYCESIGRE